MEYIKNIIIIKILGIAFLLFSVFVWNNYSFNNRLLDKILISILGYFFCYVGLYILLEQLINRYKVISFIYNKILVIPILIVFAIAFYTGPLFAVIIFFITYFVPSLILIELANHFNFYSINMEGIVYLVSLIAVILFTYKGYIVMNFITKTFKTVFGKEILQKISSKHNTRIISYCLMILIYLIYNFDTFSGIRILSFIPVEILNVLKEVFVTFVAVDTLIQLLIRNGRNMRDKEITGA